jgi:hypothetical protein
MDGVVFPVVLDCMLGSLVPCMLGGGTSAKLLADAVGSEASVGTVKDTASERASVKDSVSDLDHVNNSLQTREKNASHHTALLSANLMLAFIVISEY